MYDMHRTHRTHTRMRQRLNMSFVPREQEGLQIHIDQPMQFNIQFRITPDAVNTRLKYLAKPRVRTFAPFLPAKLAPPSSGSSSAGSPLTPSLSHSLAFRLSRPSSRLSTSPG
jgi:hypothetical protein